MVPPLTGTAVNVTLVPAQMAPAGLAEIVMLTGNIGLIVMEDVAVTCEHPPEAEMVLVTVYVPAVLDAKFTWPVAVLIKFKPAVDENVPATPPPLKVGDGFVAFEQYGVPV